ncbi:tyrosine-type recombinase/integrase [Metasolibacillus meyeri]|uniref:tyrosine-type recombinase/integrase n=1 Tax=Metasolibacillus meyeri TaxID=1071052 RepID=UPI000D31F2BB|nr:tyrosine-type recombinase/integrase [Metasolibacillus meyeri]
MASFNKRGKSWQYCFYYKKKQYRKSGFATKKAAQIAAAEDEANLRKGEKLLKESVIFVEYFEEWYKRYKEGIVTDSTLTHYEYTLRAIKEYFADTLMKDITRHNYQDFLNSYGATKSRETVEKVHSHIKSCVYDAVEEGIIKIEFTRKAIMTGAIPAKKDSEKHLNYAESEMLLKELYKRLERGLGYYLLLLGLTSGLRFGELVGLTRPDFDFKNNIINIDKTWGYLQKMHKGFGPTKNPQSIRKIKIDAKTMAAFESLFERMPTNIHQLVFYSMQSKYKVISNGTANKLLRNTLHDLGIKTTMSVHGLRHTHASISLYKKSSIYYVSERLGHGDIQTTMRDYAHVIKELREEDEKNTIGIFEKMAL